jgi:uncharacterized membrane protein
MTQQVLLGSLLIKVHHIALKCLLGVEVVEADIALALVVVVARQLQLCWLRHFRLLLLLLAVVGILERQMQGRVQRQLVVVVFAETLVMVVTVVGTLEFS